MLDHGHSLPFVYLHGLVTQFLYLSLFCVIWLGFLKHYDVLRKTICEARPHNILNILEFLKAATGAGHLSMRRWLFPIRPGEAPLMYHSVWLTSVTIVLGISFFRCYAALEWLCLFEPEGSRRLVIVLASVGTAAIGYFVVLYRHSLPLESSLAPIPAR